MTILLLCILSFMAGGACVALAAIDAIKLREGRSE